MIHYNRFSNINNTQKRTHNTISYIVFIICIAFLQSGALANDKRVVTSCDSQAAHPEDPMAITQGVEYKNIIAIDALIACRQAVQKEPSSSRLRYQLGRALDKAGKFDEAIQQSLIAAKQNHVIAQYYLGYTYAEGQNVQQDYGEAMKWYLEAAKHGHAAALNNLGSLYHNGLGVQQNYTEAAKWYQKAADKGQMYAQYNLGTLYFHGLGVEQNYTEAEKLYRKAAAQNYDGAEQMANKAKKLSSQGPCRKKVEPKITTCVVSQGLCDSNGCGNFTRCESKETYLYGESCVRELNMKATMHGSYYCHIETLAFSENINDVFDYLCQ